jgi:hypothetical protein
LPREATCGKVECVSAPDTQQGRPPPPPPPSGSPFGRFLTSPVLLVGVLALAVGIATFSYIGGDGGNPGDAGPASPGITGSWEEVPEAGAGGGSTVELELTRSGGTLTFGDCKGELTPRGDGVFAYRDTSGEPQCPLRMRVTVSLIGRDTLRIESREFSGTFQRR